MIPAIIAALAPILLPRVVDAAQAKSPAAGKVAQAAIDAVQAVTGLPVQSADQAASAVAAVRADPAMALDLARQQDDTAIRIIEADNADRADARAREVAMAAHGDHTARVLAYCVTGAFVFVTISLIAGGLLGAEGLRDPVLSTLIGTVVGYLSAKAEQVVSYYFGSSAGSKAKAMELSGTREKGRT